MIDLIADEIARRGHVSISNEAVHKAVLAAMYRQTLQANQVGNVDGNSGVDLSCLVSLLSIWSQ